MNENTADHQRILEKSRDDKEFLDSYGAVRSRVPSAAYRENFDKIVWSRTNVTHREDTTK